MLGIYFAGHTIRISKNIRKIFLIIHSLNGLESGLVFFNFAQQIGSLWNKFGLRLHYEWGKKRGS